MTVATTGTTTPATTTPATTTPATTTPAAKTTDTKTPPSKTRATKTRATTTPATEPSAGTSPAAKAPAAKAPASDRHRRAAQQAVDANHTHLEFHIGETEIQLNLPPMDKMAWYVGLAGAAAFGLIEWPIAVLAGVGHLLSDDRRNRTLRALGDALDAAA